MKMQLLVLIMLFLTGCQTSDFGFINGETVKDQPPKEQIPTEETIPQETLDQKKVNRNKLFNTDESEENVRPKIGLILGPGLSYTMAHLGALKAINDQKIPVHAIAGMGWSSLIAANYAINGAVNDMRWKAFQGSFASSVSIGFLGSSIKETGDGVYQTLIDQYTRGRAIQQAKIPFMCPALQINQSKSVILKSGSFAQALQGCMKVPPLAQTEAKTWAFIHDTQTLIRQLKQQGAQKIVFLNVIPAQGMIWAKDAGAIDARDKMFWAQVINGLNPKNLGADHILNLTTEGHNALDFKNVKRMIETSEQKANEYFAKFARTYSF